MNLPSWTNLAAKAIAAEAPASRIRKRTSRGRKPRLEGLEDRRLLAVTTLFGRGYGGTGDAVAIDAAGNTYVAGSYISSFTATPIPAIQNGTGYLAKIAPSGQALWVKNLDKMNLSDVAVDSKGNVYLAANTDGSPDALVLNPQGQDDDNPVIMNDNGNQMGLVLKFSAGGTFQGRKIFTWSNPLPGKDDNKSNFGNVRLSTIDVDATGNLYVTASYNDRVIDDGDSQFTSSPTDFDFDGNINSPSLTNLYAGSEVAGDSGTDSTAVISMTSSGSVRWITGMGGGGAAAHASLDASGNLVVVATIGNRSEFGAATFTPPAGKVHVVVARLSTANGRIQSASDVAEGSKFLSIGDVYADPSGDAILTGGYTGALRFGTTPLADVGTNTSLFLSRVTPTGAAVYAGGLSGTKAVSGVSLAGDGRGQLYLAGSNQGKVTLGPFTLTTAGQSDVFLAQINPASGGVLSAQGGLGVSSDSVSAIAINASDSLAIAGTYGGVADASPAPKFGGVSLPKDGGAFVARLQSTPPTATIAPLPAVVRAAAIPVSWSGQSPAGIASYNIFVAVDGGPLTPWLVGTALTSATYPGADGHNYGFAALGIEPSGFRSAVPAAPQAVTRVQLVVATAISVTAAPARVEQGQGVALTATVTAPGNSGPPPGSVQFLLDGQPFAGPVPLASGTATLATAAIPAGDHLISATYAGPAPFAASASAGVSLSVVAPPPPPPLVRILGGSPFTTGKRRKTIKGFQVVFSAALDAGSANDRGNYTVTNAGRDRRFGTRDDKTVAIASLSYDPGSRTLTVIPRGRITKAQPLRLTIRAGVHDGFGRPIDGNNDGQAGGDAAVQLKGSQVTTVAALEAAPPAPKPKRGRRGKSH